MINDPGDVVANEDAGSFRLAQQSGRGIGLADTSGQVVNYDLDDYVVDFLRLGDSSTAEPLVLCNTPVQVPNVNPCVQAAFDQAAFQAQERYEDYLDSVMLDSGCATPPNASKPRSASSASTTVPNTNTPSITMTIPVP